MREVRSTLVLLTRNGLGGEAISKAVSKGFSDVAPSTHTPPRIAGILTQTSNVGRPEHELYTATLTVLSGTPVADCSRVVILAVVQSLAPQLAYRGRRHSFHQYRIDSISRKAYWWIHQSGKWEERVPQCDPLVRERNRERSRIAAWKRTTDAEGKYIDIVTFLEEGHTLAEASTRWNRTTVWRARKWATGTCFTITTSPQNLPGGSRGDIDIEEIELVEPASVEEARVSPAVFAEPGTPLHRVLLKQAQAIPLQGGERASPKRTVRRSLRRGRHKGHLLLSRLQVPPPPVQTPESSEQVLPVERRQRCELKTRRKTNSTRRNHNLTGSAPSSTSTISTPTPCFRSSKTAASTT